MMRRFLIYMVVCYGLLTSWTVAQTDAAFTQYFAVPAYYNPAQPGSTDFLDIKGAARLQWIGIEGAPKDFYLGAGMPLALAKQRFGVGVQLTQESAGLFRTFSGGAQLSYKIKLFKGWLSVGVQPGFINQSFRASDIYIPETEEGGGADTDEALPTRDITGTTFDLAVGLWYSRPRWWIGVSGRHITSPSISIDSENNGNGTDTDQYEFKTLPAIYLMGGGNIPIKNTLFEINPSCLLSYTDTFFNWEVTALVGWKKMFFGGFSYRWKSAVSIILGAEIKGFFLEYSYDYPTSAIARATHGSHELVAGYKLKLNLNKNDKYKYKNIRIL